MAPQKSPPEAKTRAAPRRPRAARVTSKAAHTREHLLAVAADLLKEVGLARFSTRLFAQRAGVAEGTLYHHFPDKQALIVECIAVRAYGLQAIIGDLPMRVGTGDITAHLVDLCAAALTFFDEAIILMCNVLSDAPTLAWHRDFMEAQHHGPVAERERIAIYLAAEQRLGRIQDDADPGLLASLLLHSMSAQANMDTLMGRVRTPEETRAYASSVVLALGKGFLPT
jgi:AcrR family transcriptional regulator